ncbi:MAG: hypothetical protein JJU27_18320 [Gammaproteobacteria bacterium]|nr:hypothetical protein [Gammaproteobacteria bacterium]
MNFKRPFISAILGVTAAFATHIHAQSGPALPPIDEQLVADATSVAISQTTFSIFRQPDEIRRIFEGDWSWTTQSARQDQQFLAYALEMNRRLAEVCPGIVPGFRRAEQQAFQSVWFGAAMSITTASGSSLGDLSSVLELTARTLTLREAVLQDVATLASAGLALDQQDDSERMCETRLLSHVANALHLLASGRRPEEGFGLVRDTTVSGEIRLLTFPAVGLAESRLGYEEQRALSARHNYYIGSTLPSPAYDQMINDMRQLTRIGQQVLECHYETDPGDPFYNVQFYWSLDLASYLAFSLPVLAETFIRTAQGSLERVAGNRHVRHPFLYYGSPRHECPAELDPQLPHIRLTPFDERGHVRVEVVPFRPPAAAKEVSPPTEPETPPQWKVQHHNLRSGESEPRFGPDYNFAFISVQFDNVSSDFRLPPPGEIEEIAEAIRMFDESLRHGTRSYEIRISQPPTFLQHDQLFRMRLGVLSIEHHLAVSRNLDMPGHSRSALFNGAAVREAVASLGGAPLVLTCGYFAGLNNEGDPRASARYYWYLNRPAAFQPDILRAIDDQHPLLAIGDPVSDCPPEAEPRRIRQDTEGRWMIDHTVINVSPASTVPEPLPRSAEILRQAR